MNIQEFKEQLPSLIEQALVIGRDVIGEDCKLTKSIDSIGELDKVVASLHNLWKKKLIDDNIVRNTAYLLGTLLGEMIINELGYHWLIEEGFPVVETLRNNQLSPISKIFKIITDEDSFEGTPSGFYKTFITLERFADK